MRQETQRYRYKNINGLITGFRGDIRNLMPTIEELKELLGKKVRGLTLSNKSKEELSRPSPLPPMSPFTHVRDIVRERDANNETKKEPIVLSDEIVRNIQKAGH